MKPMKYKGYAARIDYDAEAEIFVGRVVGLRETLRFNAENVPGLKAALAQTVDAYLEKCRRNGDDPERPYSGNLMLRVAAEVHAKAAQAAELSGKSLSQWAERVLDEAADHVLTR